MIAEIKFSQPLPPGYRVIFDDSHYQWEYREFEWNEHPDKESEISCDRWAAYRGAWKDFIKEIGRGPSIDIEGGLTENDGFDRRKIGKVKWPCGHQFNPYYQTSFKEGEWGSRWVADSHKEPSADCKVKCPRCKKEYFFRVYVGQ